MQAKRTRVYNMTNKYDKELFEKQKEKLFDKYYHVKVVWKTFSLCAIEYM